MKYVLLFFFVVGCGSTNVKKYKNLKALPTDTPVAVFTEKHPPLFDYEEVCEVIIERGGMTATEDITSYEEDLKAQARLCGASLVVLGKAKKAPQLIPLKAQTAGDVVYVGATAIRQTSEERKLSDNKISQLVKAVKKDDPKKISELLKGLNPDPAKRFSFDGRVLEALVLSIAEKGSSCSQKLLSAFKPYHPVVTHLVRSPSIGARGARNIIFCDGFLLNHYQEFTNRFKLNDYIYDRMDHFFLQYKGTKTDGKNLNTLAELFPVIEDKSRFLNLKFAIQKKLLTAKNPQAASLKKILNHLSN